MDRVVAKHGTTLMGVVLAIVATVALVAGRVGYLAAAVMYGVSLVLMGMVSVFEVGFISLDVDDE